MPLYRKKPIVIEAEQFCYPQYPQEGMPFGLHGQVRYDWWSQQFVINTLEGEMKVSHGDWIIRGVNGEYYPCKDNIFRKTYEPVDDTE